ncbi:MAG: FliM/FliN family flagellar motor switch protein [Chlamydiales bacterium]|nr:FliM/FliN family flagellar motor switch protein [Chlamydiales bacterium]
MEISFDFTPLLGTAELDAADYHQLQVGDVIVLDQEAEAPLKIIVGESYKFEATPGLLHNHKAVKIDG